LWSALTLIVDGSVPHGELLNASYVMLRLEMQTFWKIIFGQSFQNIQVLKKLLKLDLQSSNLGAIE
jgi:hypothetical protein